MRVTVAMTDSGMVKGLGLKYQVLRGVFDERSRRQWAAAEAMSIGRGGISALVTATGMARNTIKVGIGEVRDRLSNPKAEISSRIRAIGGGRKALTTVDSELASELDRLVDPATCGHPETALRWTSKSTSKLAGELSKTGHQVSARTVAHLLKGAQYSLQSNRKTQEGKSNPDRNLQFEHIHRRVKSFQKRGQPVVSVDAKKKEIIGNHKNAGREWQQKHQPMQVKTHDFPDPKVGKAIP